MKRAINWNGWKEISGSIQYAIFPTRCKARECDHLLVSRDEMKTGICNECRAFIQMSQENQCLWCGRWIESNYESCGECIIKPPPFLRHLSFCRYNGLFKDLLLLYKYGEVEKLKFLFAECLVELYQAKIAGNIAIDAIIPVPQDRGRKREFNHTLEVTRKLAQQLGITLLPHGLIKKKKTIPQAGLNRHERLKNLNGAFAVPQPRTIEGKTLLLIDDVYTTGTTIRQCTRTLKQYNTKVVAITLARP